MFALMQTAPDLSKLAKTPATEVFVATVIPAAAWQKAQSKIF
jgi:hypothetical protein